jgi:hypothetical protein
MNDSYKKDTFRMQSNPLTMNQTDRVNTVKTYAMNMERILHNCVPQSRELSLCMTKLEEIVMWATKKITEPLQIDIHDGFAGGLDEAVPGADKTVQHPDFPKIDSSKPAFRKSGF